MRGSRHNARAKKPPLELACSHRRAGFTFVAYRFAEVLTIISLGDLLKRVLKVIFRATQAKNNKIQNKNKTINEN